MFLLLAVVGLLVCRERFLAPLPYSPAPVEQPQLAPVEQPQLHYEWDGTRFVLTYEHIDSTSRDRDSVTTTMSEHNPATSSRYSTSTSSAVPGTPPDALSVSNSAELVDSGNVVTKLEPETDEVACDPEDETMQIFGNDVRCLDMLDWCSQLSEYGYLANSCTCACWGLAQPPPAADRRNNS